MEPLRPKTSLAVLHDLVQHNTAVTSSFVFLSHSARPDILDNQESHTARFCLWQWSFSKDLCDSSSGYVHIADHLFVNALEHSE